MPLMAIIAIRIWISRNLRRVAGEKRLDIMRLGALDDEIDPIARNVHARQLCSTISLTCAMTMPLLKAVASTITGVSSVLGPV